jgi:hypothetical protein
VERVETSSMQQTGAPAGIVMSVELVNVQHSLASLHSEGGREGGRDPRIVRVHSVETDGRLDSHPFGTRR